jgi:hypothetical protein
MAHPHRPYIAPQRRASAASRSNLCPRPAQRGSLPTNDRDLPLGNEALARQPAAVPTLRLPAPGTIPAQRDSPRATAQLACGGQGEPEPPCRLVITGDGGQGGSA